MDEFARLYAKYLIANMTNKDDMRTVAMSAAVYRLTGQPLSATPPI